MEVTSGSISKIMKKLLDGATIEKFKQAMIEIHMKTPTVPMRCWKFNNNILLLILT